MAPESCLSLSLNSGRMKYRGIAQYDLKHNACGILKIAIFIKLNLTE